MKWLSGILNQKSEVDLKIKGLKELTEIHVAIVKAFKQAGLQVQEVDYDCKERVLKFNIDVKPDFLDITTRLQFVVLQAYDGNDAVVRNEDNTFFMDCEISRGSQRQINHLASSFATGFSKFIEPQRYVVTRKMPVQEALPV